MLVCPGFAQRNRKLGMKENAISRSARPLPLAGTPRIILFFVVNIVPHGWYYSSSEGIKHLVEVKNCVPNLICKR